MHFSSIVTEWYIGEIIYDQLLHHRKVDTLAKKLHSENNPLYSNCFSMYICIVGLGWDHSEM